MATLSQSLSRKKYSWWWDSHISPKNSKWLQENLTDMDAKVKSMIKLIEEDADSFARRAEMYYKKRPELMKLVEEFYRAYRALAERYDHATGALRQAAQAHKTMAEAFPNQIPFMLADDSPADSASDADPHTPKKLLHTRAFFDLDDSQKDASGLSSSQLHSAKRNGAFTDESDTVIGRKGLKQLNDLLGSIDHARSAEGKVRKVLNFSDADEKERSVQSNENHSLQGGRVPETEQMMAKYEKEILSLREALAKLKAEKESGLEQYHQSLERLSNVESEVSRAQEDSRGFNERASKAEVEVQNLKKALTELENEKDAKLVQYQQSLERIANLEDAISRAHSNGAELTELASKAETEVQALKQDLSTLEVERNTALDQYKQSLDMISDLEKKLLLAEENARKFSERAEKAEREVENLKEALAKLTEEKEAAALQYHQCMETIFSLEHKLSCAQEEAQRLSGEIDDGIAKLKDAEERCVQLERSNQSLHSELETTVLKMGTQTQELTEKQEELGKLWVGIQEERRRFVEAETAFQTLQHLHAQAQEELRSLALELQNHAQIFSDMENRNQSLQDDILKAKEENKHLNELNLSSSMSIKDMQIEIFSLRDAKGKLEEEVELRVDQRNALQQEIYCLKEELNELNKKHQAMVDQVEAVGFDPESFESSVKELQDENSILKETCQREISEKVALLEKLEIMKQLLEKNALLENSLSDLSAELEAVRAKILALEESCQSLVYEKSILVDEKATLVTQLQLATGNLEKLSERNTFLENSLSDTHVELEGLKEKSRSLEDLCQLLNNEKSGLINLKDSLSSQLNITQQNLVELEKRYAELQEKHSELEKEKDSTISKAEELKLSLDSAKYEHASFTQLSERRLAGMETQICLLQEEGGRRRRELEDELDKALHSQIEIFVLQRCAKDLEGKNSSLLSECQKLLTASKSSEKLISELHQENRERQVEVTHLSDQTNKLQKGIDQLLKALNIDLSRCEENNGQENVYLNFILHKIEEAIISVCKTQDDNHQLAIQISILVTLLAQLKFAAANLKMEKNSLDLEFKMRTEQLSLLQIEARELSESNEALKLKVREGYLKDETLTIQIENLQVKLLDLQQAYQNLQEENSKVVEEKSLLMKEFLELDEKKCALEEELCIVFGENLLLGSRFLIYENFVNAKSVDLKEAAEDITELHSIKSAIEEKLKLTERTLEKVEMENISLQEKLKHSEGELKTSASVNGQLSYENGSLCETNHKLEVELHQLHEENERSKSREEILCLELQREKSEIYLLESEAAALFGELQFSNVCLALYEQKIHELAEAYRCLEDQGISRDMDIELLKEKISSLEGENGGLKAQLAAYVPTVMSLRNCISSLETKIPKDGNADDKAKDSEVVSCLPVENCHSEAQGTMTVPDALSDLQDLESRVKAIEKAMVEKERLLMLENLEAHSKVEAAMRQIEELKSKQSSRNVKSISEISEADNALLTKDIMLDQISECSSYGISRKDHVGNDSRNLESWETTGQNGSIDLTVGKAKKKVTEGTEKDVDRHQDEAVKGRKSQFPSSEELVDKLEISRPSTEPLEEGNKRKVLERLNSDLQKLTNLKITVQDLKRKVESTEKSGKKGKATVEYDGVQGQLEEAEEAILKLFDVNGKLMKHVENGSFSSNGKFATDSEETRRIRRKKISDSARRVSEKIGRLQLEIQKIQFLLVKLDDEKESKERIRIAEMKRRVLLRDYLYGAARSPRRKKTPFCGCVQPPTKGD